MRTRRHSQLERNPNGSRNSERKQGNMRATFVVLMAALAMLLGVQRAWATNFINTAAGGNWSTPASWTLNSGFPGSGDTIALSAAGTITVSSAQQFGNTSGSSMPPWRESPSASKT